MRVIGGTLGGRVIKAPPGLRTRPTTDRVREALFSMLGDVAGLSVLDLYAGSGALGIEALSRGAARAAFVESWPTAAAVLARNVGDLDLTARSQLIRAPVERSQRRLLQLAPFDLVFCDPPWADLVETRRTLLRLLQPDLLAPDARLVVEHPADEPFDLPAPGDPGAGAATLWVSARSKAWGDTGVTLFANAGPPPAGSDRGL